MKYNNYYIESTNHKSNCVIRSICKLYNLDDYDKVYDELVNICKKLNMNSYNDIEVFEEYFRLHNTFKIETEEVKIKDLKLDSGSYIIFCYDKKDYYHMVTIIDNVLYDKNDNSLELYVISIYKKGKEYVKKI